MSQTKLLKQLLFCSLIDRNKLKQCSRLSHWATLLYRPESC